MFKLQRPQRTLTMACPIKKKKMEEKKVKLRMEKDRVSGRSYAGVASAAPVSTTRIVELS